MRYCGRLKEDAESFPMMLRLHESDVWMPSYCVPNIWKKIWNMLAEINKIYCAYCVNHVIQFLASSRHFPVTFSQPSCNFQGIFRIRSGVSVGRKFGDAHLIAGWGTKCQICNPSICRRHFTIHSLTFWLPGMRHEVPNLQSIYLLKMCCNSFTHFLIARLRHEVPNW